MGIFELDRSVEGKQGSTSRTREGTKPPGTGLRATWLGHSTVFIEIDGYRVLTDRVA